MVTPATIAVFDALPRSKVRYLSVDENVLITAACVAFAKALDSNPLLEYVSLKNCDISLEGCGAIVDALPRCPNLQFLLLDSNCIFEKGVDRLARKIEASSLVGLSISDNHVWSDGTTGFLKALPPTTTLTSLDLSYNMVDLEVLSQTLKRCPQLQHLSISGCKIKERQLPTFLEELSQCSLTTFVMEGIDTHDVPVIWPRPLDTVFADRGRFDILHRTLQASQTLTDLRFGFLDLDQINLIGTWYQQNQLTRPLDVSLSDFGRTKVTWVVQFPDFVLRAPSPVFHWAHRIGGTGAQCLGQLFKRSLFGDDGLESLDIHGIGVTDGNLTGIAGSFQGSPVTLRMLDLSGNDFGDKSVETILPFFEASAVDELRLVQTQMTDFGFQLFFRSFSQKSSGKFPRVLSFSFGSQDTSETALHPFFNPFAQLISSNCPLEELTVKGLVTPVDLATLLQGLDRNSTLRKLVIETKAPEKQRGEAPVDSAVQGPAHDLIVNLHRTLTDPNSICVLNTFVYPPLMPILTVNESIMALWHELEDVLQANRNKQF
jgi:Ran GTPase-activating protein (RanGAP) involved in mRNA processing and transport